MLANCGANETVQLRYQLPNSPEPTRINKSASRVALRAPIRPASGLESSGGSTLGTPIERFQAE
jgi:hypothetical protein